MWVRRESRDLHAVRLSDDRHGKGGGSIFRPIVYCIRESNIHAGLAALSLAQHGSPVKR